MKKYEGQVKIGDKIYKVAVIDGVRYMDGKTCEEFLRTCSPEEKINFAKLGMVAINDEKNGGYSPKKYEYLINDKPELEKHYRSAIDSLSEE